MTPDQSMDLDPERYKGTKPNKAERPQEEKAGKKVS
jgi:hypothetical protein